MKVPKQDADLFFKLMWRLQLYVNQQRQVLPSVRTLRDYVELSSEDKVKVRDALWEHPDLIDAYVKENPDGLVPEELGIIQKWKRYVAGTFQIYRLLKKHAILVGEKSQVYGVLGLRDSLEDMLGGQPLPVMVQTVLLPFRGKIVYDGMLRSYNVTFGKGIRSSLHEEYMRAKQNDRIITTLEPELGKPEREIRRKPDKDWQPVLDSLVQTTERMRGGPAVQSSTFGLLRASARLAQAAARSPDDLDELWHHEQQVRKALTRLQRILHRAE
ncbi:MAG: hypothetical protein J7M39_13860 [Anaerolineae bacterium]|nr:hypothetical protein [Anaerolineae bacterium]